MKLASKDERWNEIMFVHLKDFKRLLKQAYTIGQVHERGGKMKDESS